MAILTVSGSPSLHSKSRLLLEHLRDGFAARGHSTDHVDVRGLPARPLLQLEPADRQIEDALARVARAAVVVVATPVYKASCSGLLKAFLDLLPQDGLRGKTVLSIATGGSVAHTLALDYGLKPILSALGVEHQLPGIFVPDTQISWSADGGLQLAPETARRIGQGLQRLIEIAGDGARSEAAVGSRRAALMGAR